MKQGKFKLKITLGNDAMQTCDDVAEALRDIADRLERGFVCEGIRDKNGNTVGVWHLTGEDT